ncbi:MAG: alpha/beta hydrolase [Prevotellaceae bacterium]|jgi:acetyl esterase/lipase|nr:alpha/beta hydrolase [Prevotellaceae bacterium]
MKQLQFLLSLLMFSFCTSLSAQNIEVIYLWANGAPNSSGLTGEEQQLENGRIGNVTNPTIKVYRPDNPNGLAVIMCPGGGYFRLAINHEGYDMAQWFNTQGITYIVLKYRMPNGHPEVPLSDIEQAIRIVREHAAEWKINPNKVGVMGASAGGHLASLLATQYTDKNTRPDFHVLLYPAISMLESNRSSLLGNQPSEELKIKYSNELHVTEDTPPAFITFSTDDGLAANAIKYYLALLEHHVQVSLHAYPTGGHGWGFLDTFLYKRQWTEELEKWLRTLLDN